MAETLLRNGANVDDKTKFGYMALQVATKQGISFWSISNIVIFIG